MPRHRGQYKPERPEPYEISRGNVENYIKCPACFWLDRVGGAHFPSIPGFNLNTTTDLLLKKDFDRYRGQKPHPIMQAEGLHSLRPFEHVDLVKWESSLHFGLSPNHFNTIHEQTNFCFGGGLDDAWEDINTGLIHIVDYKSTAQLGKVSKPLDHSFLDDYWKTSYKRQLEMYQWIMRRKGFNVSDRGFFMYVEGQHRELDGMIDEDQTTKAYMEFSTSIIPYDGNDSWVEPTLIESIGLLETKQCPSHSDRCEHGIFLNEVQQALK